MPRFRIIAAFGLCLIALGACTQPTPYQPAVDRKFGYTTVPLSQNRFRIAFSGNTQTSRATVEDYLLFRAAEVTLASGASHFTVVERDVEPETRFRSTGTAASTRFVRGYDPFVGVGIGSADLRPITRYDAYLEIVLGRSGPEPEIYAASDVQQAIAPRVIRPEKG